MVAEVVTVNHLTKFLTESCPNLCFGCELSARHILTVTTTAWVKHFDSTHIIQFKIYFLLEPVETTALIHISYSRFSMPQKTVLNPVSHPPLVGRVPESLREIEGHLSRLYQLSPLQTLSVLK